jgi:hypothetical protein
MDMWKRLVLLAVPLMCALTLAPLAQPLASSLVDDTPQLVSQVDLPDVGALTEADREVLRQAEQSSDPGLESLRAGHWGYVLLVVLLVVLIIAVAD